MSPHARSSLFSNVLMTLMAPFRADTSMPPPIAGSGTASASGNCFLASATSAGLTRTVCQARRGSSRTILTKCSG